MFVIGSERIPIRIPIKAWLENPADIEDGALEQAKNLANLPFAYKWIAIMPDCLTENTEVLTSTGFKLIRNLTSADLIANYNLNTGRCFFKSPKNIIKREMRVDEKIFSFLIPMIDKEITVSENHRMPLKEGTAKACEISNITEVRDYFWGGCGLDIQDYDISDEELCLIAWIVGDGSIKKSNKRKDGTFSSINIRFGLTKERKILRIISLLDSLGIAFGYNKNPKQTTINLCVNDSRRLVDIYVGENKRYPKYFIEKLSTRQALLFLEECLKVDGDWINYQKYGGIKYNSTRQEDIDFLSALISLHKGIANNGTRYTEGYKKVKTNYLSAIPNQNLIAGGNGIAKNKVIKRKIEYSGKLVCVTCDAGFFIARQNGFTFVTGNCHQGYGMPIGGVLATKDGYIIPNAVGVDIGCGMCAFPLDVKANEIPVDQLKEIMGLIRERIPVGFKHQEEAQDEHLMPNDFEWIDCDLEAAKGFSSPQPSIYPVVNREFNSALKQIGTLGGGNHFIEIQKDEDGMLWVMVHSGSRNIGLKVAKHYNELAKELNQRYISSVPKAWDLAFLHISTPEGKSYLREMQYCVDFALANRKLMMQRVLEAFTEVALIYIPYEWDEKMINIAHNYAAWENHYGQNVIVHRKGATRARAGELGIIPGCQGSSSYIVRGLGCPESFFSCSHGAGRRMSRTKAREELDLTEQIAKLDAAGVIHGLRHKKELDEAPDAYKDIRNVMANQSDLVEIVHELTPLAVIKG